MLYDIYMTHRRKGSRDAWIVTHWQQDAQHIIELRNTIILLVNAMSQEYGRLDIHWPDGHHDECPSMTPEVTRG